MSTWNRTYLPYLNRLVEVAGSRAWPDESDLLEAVLRNWEPNSRARQMAHDRIRALWKQAGWEWPETIVAMRGNGKAAAAAEGVRAFNDPEIQELRARLLRSYRLTPADLVAWDCLIAFGLRPAELQGLELRTDEGLPLAQVTRTKRSSKGSSGPRAVHAVPPEDWPADCFDLVQRFQEHGLPPGMVAARSPGEVLGQQLARLMDRQPMEIELPRELTPYGLRHAFALRLGLQLGLHVRESAQLMGHSPQVHLSTYGRRLDAPKLLATVRDRVMAR
jgi:integrase